MGAVQPGLIANLLLWLIVANAASMYSTPDAGAATIGLPVPMRDKFVFITAGMD